MRRGIAFEADAGGFMLGARLAQALMDTCDHDPGRVSLLN
jgi:hypothetical protein